MTDYTLTLQISSADLPTLQAAGQQIVLVRKLADAGQTVAWAVLPLALNRRVGWNDSYTLYASNTPNLIGNIIVVAAQAGGLLGEARGDRYRVVERIGHLAVGAARGHAEQRVGAALAVVRSTAEADGVAELDRPVAFAHLQREAAFGTREAERRLVGRLARAEPRAGQRARRHRHRQAGARLQRHAGRGRAVVERGAVRGGGEADRRGGLFSWLPWRR